MTESSPVDLSRYSTGGFDRGRGFIVELLWRIFSAVVFESPFFPFYGLKRCALRLFGAKVGRGVLIKPRARITFPWKVTLGDFCWIGEEAWLDSLAEIRIGDHACVSQRAYLCTGNHDYKSETFDLRPGPIEIGRGAWVAAATVVGPGVKIGTGAVLSLGSVAVSDLEPYGIYQGIPATKIGDRNKRG